jgi:hypothetical protein
VFVDYQTVGNNGPDGAWTPATLVDPVVVDGQGTLSAVANGRGFYVKGTTPTFSSTVTVALDGLAPGTKFNWCAYASDYPPNATPGTGAYDLHGSPPFKVNNVLLTDGVRTYSGCINELTDATGCPGLIPAKLVVTAFTPLDTAICAGQNVTLTATATSATAYSFNNGASWTAANTVTIAPTQDTSCTVWVRNVAGCEVAYGTAASITVRPKPVASFSSATPSACTGSSVTVVAGGGSSYCFTHRCTACEHNPYSSGNDIATEFDCVFDNLSCSPSTSNSYTLTLPDAGSVTVSVVVTNNYGCTATIDTTITALLLPTLTFLSAASTTQQTVEAGVPIAPIEYAVANATDAIVAGLPDGAT